MTSSLSHRIISGDLAAAPCREFIQLKANNLVERPWGGLRMLEYKGCAPLPDQKKITGLGVGEAFETAACASDPECDAHPSTVILADGSTVGLPELLRCAGREIMGAPLYARFQDEIPLLPKTLDIQELLSIQAHPPGNTELYVIIDAEPGATLRLGFRHSINADSLRADLAAARNKQEEMIGWLRKDVDQLQLQQVLAPAFADRAGDIDKAALQIKALLNRPEDFSAASLALKQLKLTYWQVLDMMNEIPLHPGQIIYNATPERVRSATGMPISAEVHALGNPEGREIMMLEIRRPGVTYRAWDNVRFPLREIDIDRTLESLHLGATNPEEFEVRPAPRDSEPGVCRLVDGEHFIVDQVQASRRAPVAVAAGYFHTLHVTSGSARLEDHSGNSVQLIQGSSVIVPAGVRKYEVTTPATAQLIRVQLPPR